MRNYQKNGFTLVEVLVTLGLIAFLSGATLSFVSFVRRDIAKQETLAIRNTEQGMFFSILSQPAYVGALAEYAENESLKKCLDVDTEICETKKDYPLKAFDLEKGELLEVVDSDHTGNVKNEFSFQVHCPLNQTACDQADYLSVKIKSSIKNDNSLQFSSEKIVVVQPKRSNVLTLVPNTKLEPGSPVNVIIVLDGSNSMSGIKDSFKATLQKLVDELKNLDATVAVYPLQDNVWAKYGQSYVIDGSGNKKYLTWPEEDAMVGGQSRYVDVEWLLSTGLSYNSVPISSARIFTFKSTMTDAERQVIGTALQNRIDGTFAEMVSSNGRDAALCGLLRLFDQTAEGKSPFEIDSTTPTVLMVLTNEDDESILLKPGATFMGLPTPYTLDNDYICAKGVTQKWTRDYGKVWYYGDKYVYKVTGTSTTIIDGAPYSKAFNDVSLTSIPYRSTHVAGADCLADAKGSDKVAVEKSLQYNNYANTLNYTLTSCKVVLNKESTIGVSPEGTHPCVSIEANPSQYPYFVPGTCTEKNIPSTDMGWAGSGATVLGYYVPTDLEAHATGSLPKAIYNLMKSKFNLDKFIVSMVINPTSGVCPATPGSAVGTKYEQFANMPGLSAQIVPICSADYGAKVLEISKKLEAMGMSDFTLPVGVGNRLSGVDVLRNSTIISATEGSDYKRNGDLIIFNPGFVLSTDVVRFYLK